MQNGAQERSEGTDERAEVEAMIRRHAETTKSERAWKVLASWEDYALKSVKLMPKDYQRMLDAIRHTEAEGLSGEGGGHGSVLKQTKNDLARVQWKLREERRDMRKLEKLLASAAAAATGVRFCRR